jgi:hypothetical protein
MGKLDKPGLDALLAAGCPACGSKALAFRTYVDAALPLLEGEPVGRLGWVYDGEKFLDGVFAAACTDCKAEVFSDAECPRCHAPEGLARALTSENTFEVPTRCPRCEALEVRYIAMVPAKVVYERGRAQPARTTVELLDPGFHGYRVDCKRCGKVAELTFRCPLCEAPGPLRPRPH